MGKPLRPESGIRERVVAESGIRLNLVLACILPVLEISRLREEDFARGHSNQTVTPAPRNDKCTRTENICPRLMPERPATGEERGN
jgi:hypothetical protein